MSDQTIHNVTSLDWVVIDWIGENRTVSASAMTWLEWHEELLELRAERDALAAELARLRTLEAALPKTADGVPVVPGSGSRLWYIHPDSHTIYERSYTADMRDARSHWIGDHQERHDVVWIGVEQCYSTREAAEAAREAEKAREA